MCDLSGMIPDAPPQSSAVQLLLTQKFDNERGKWVEFSAT